MSSSHQFAIMCMHGGQKNHQEVCANDLSHSAISSIDSGKGSRIWRSQLYALSSDVNYNNIVKGPKSNVKYHDNCTYKSDFSKFK